MRTKCPFNDLEQHEIDQIWAEAKYYYERGDKNILTQPESIEMASALQEQHWEDNGLKGRKEAFLDIPIPRDWYSLSNNEKQSYFEEKSYNDASDLL